jgi:hypothetical protein
LKNSGYKNRLKISDFLYKNIIDYDEKFIKKNLHLSDKVTDLKNNQITNKKNVLIIGNSHGKNLFYSFYLNKFLFRDYNFSYFESNPTCLLNYIKYQKLCIKKSEIQRRKNYKLSYSKIKYADIIIFSNRWSDLDIKSLADLINSDEIKKKIIIITSGFPEFNFDNFGDIFLKMDNYNNKTLIKQLYHRYTPTDKFLLNNNRFPNFLEKENIEREYYKLLNLEKYQQNIKYLKSLENKKNIIFLDQYKYVCDFSTKKCTVYTNKMEKIHIDSVGHQSLSGSEFFGKIIHKISWFRTN